MDVIICKNVPFAKRWKLSAAILRENQSPGPRHGARLEPQLKHSSITHRFCVLFSLSTPLALTPPPSFFPTGPWAPLGALLVPSSPPPWRGGGPWSGAWAGATTPRHQFRSGTAGTSTKCHSWYATSWSPATSVWSYWPRLRWASPCCCSSTTVRFPQQ